MSSTSPDTSFDLEEDDDCVEVIAGLRSEIVVLEDRIVGWEDDYDNLDRDLKNEKDERAAQVDELERKLQGMADLLLDIKNSINHHAF